MSKTTRAGLVMASLLASMTVASAALAPVDGRVKKLHYEKTFSLDAGSLQEIEFSAPTKEQKLSVTITSTVAGVSAYLLKSSNLNAVKAALEKEKEPAAELLLKGRRTKGMAETFTLEATIPAKTVYVLLLKVNKKTEVKIKLVGR